ncbi:MAG: cyclic nucleotide-binding domain-containing protein [Thermodesulfobacteriota bacterium]
MNSEDSLTNQGEILKINEPCMQSLREIRFFSFFDQSELLELVRSGTWIRIPSGTLIIREGRTEETLYVLVHGNVRVFKNKKTLDILESGSIFGEMGALLYEPRSANVITLEECYLFQYKEQDFLRLPKNILYPVMKYIFSVTAKRLQKTNRKYALL